MYRLWLVELHGKKAQPQEQDLNRYSVLAFLWSSTPQVIVLKS